MNNNPELILTPHKRDIHHTHKKVTSVLMRIASERITILGYDSWSPVRKPDITVNISEEIEKKIDGINNYESRIEYKDYAEGVKGLNKYNAVFSDYLKTDSFAYAECFKIIQKGKFLNKYRKFLSK